MRKISLTMLGINILLCILSISAYIFLYINNIQGIEILGLFSLFQLIILPYFFSKYINKFDIFSPLVIVNGAYFLYFVFTPLSDIITNNLNYFSIDVFPYFRKGILVSIFSIIFMYIGYVFSSFLKEKKTRKIDKDLLIDKNIDEKKVLNINKKMMIIFLILFTIYTITSGNSWIKFLSFGQLGSVSNEMFDKSGLNSYLADVIDCFLAIYLIFCVYTRKYIKYTIIFIPIFAAVL